MQDLHVVELFRDIDQRRHVVLIEVDLSQQRTQKLQPVEFVGVFPEKFATVDNPVDQKVIRLIADVGREAGMRTIAEYVQNAEALALLSELGVDMAQGYFVGKPTKVPEFASTPISLTSHRARRQGHRARKTS